MPQGIVFDFDFTLADPTQGTVECVNFALKKLALPQAAPEKIKRTIGLSLEDTLRSLISDPNAMDVESFKKNFVEKADQVMADRTFILDTVPSTTKKLIESGFKLGIVSTKFRYRIEEILRREKLLNRFSAIVGGEDVVEHKPHPEGLTTVISMMEMDSGDILYVGDSTVDAITAERAKVFFAAVLTGTTTKCEFDDVTKVAIIKNLAALPELL